MQGKVEICGVNTARLPVLKNEEMMALLRRTKEGDRAAREQLICGNLRLVLSVIQRFSSRGENADDLFQVGCIGLIKAIDHFDPAQPVRFSTYGVPMIIGEIRRFLRDNNALRVSRSLRDTAYRAMQSREALEKQLKMMETILYLYDKCAALVAKQVPVSRLLATGLFDELVQMKYTVPNDDLSKLDELQKAIDTKLAAVAQG